MVGLDLNPVHTSNNVEAALSNATKSNVASTLLLVDRALEIYRHSLVSHPNSCRTQLITRDCIAILIGFGL